MQSWGLYLVLLRALLQGANKRAGDLPYLKRAANKLTTVPLFLPYSKGKARLKRAQHSSTCYCQM